MNRSSDRSKVQIITLGNTLHKCQFLLYDYTAICSGHHVFQSVYAAVAILFQRGGCKSFWDERNIFLNFIGYSNCLVTSKQVQY